MANSKAIRADDVSGLNIRTFTITEAAETRHMQSVVLSDPDDGTGMDIVSEGALAKGIQIYVSDGTNPVIPRADATTKRLEVEAQGDAAHDAPVSGNPVLLGGIAETAADSAPGNRASADGDAVRLAVDLDGSKYVLPHGPQIWSYHENSSSALTDAAVHAAPSAGLSLYVTDIVISTGAATAYNAFFEEGTTTVLGPYYLEATAGRGLALQLRTPKKITAATALTITTSAAIAHGIDITGYIAPG